MLPPVHSTEQILVIAPHPDDESIGCGGTLALHRARGDRVSVLFLTSGERGINHIAAAEVARIRRDEAQRALAVLSVDLLGFLELPDGGIGEEIERSAAAVANAMGLLKVDRIYLPHPKEDHEDHMACLPVMARAYELMERGEPWLLGYEVWTPLDRYDQVEDVSAVYDLKRAAVGCYASQLAQFRYDRGSAGLNAYRGAMAGHCEYAEVFASLSFEG